MNLYESILKEYNRKAQYDYEKWSTALSCRDKVLEKVVEVKNKIDSGELKDIKTISEALQSIVDSYD